MPVELPAWVQEKIDRENMVERHLHAASSVLRDLKALDPRLSVAKVGEGHPPHFGMMPGYWHVVRHNDPPAQPSYIPICGPNGEFVEPHSGVVEALKRADLQRRDVFEEVRNRYEYEVKAKERRDALESEQRRDVMAETIRAAKRVAGEGGMNKRLWAKGKAA